ncbi:MAG: DUF1552 domain-containing protein [Acidobacteria bacterium]|nr:DUF1552 domain-containing protein [Acidobacteriota bacterium]
MMILKKAIARRAFLRGTGAVIALPLLDGMVPAFASALGSNGEAGSRAPVRLGFINFPNGAIMDKWTPAADGAKFDLPPILEALAPYREKMLVISGLSHVNGHRRMDEAGGDHSRAAATWLTGAHPKKTEGDDIRVGISADQLAAQTLGKQTQLASLEMTLDNTDLVGGCEGGYSCSYINTVSWRTATTPVPMENQPRAVFERLFGDSDSTDPAERLTRIQEDRSVLDAVSQDVSRLQRKLGAGDQNKLAEFFDAIRDIERRIQMSEDQSARQLPSLVRPAGVPERYDDYSKLMYDLMVLAFQTDMTRVQTMYLSREQSNRAYTELGISEAHHALSHHFGDARKIAQMVQINMFHVKLLSYFLDRLQSTPDGDGSLLDHSLLLYGSSLSDGNIHSHDDLPNLLIGGGAGQVRGGRHIKMPTDTPMTNLLLSVLDKVNVHVDKLGDSTGRVELPSA